MDGGLTSTSPYEQILRAKAAQWLNPIPGPITHTQLSSGAAIASHLRSAGFAVLNDVVLNQVLVSFGSPEETRSVIAELQSEGTCWCGGTVWQGHTAMRISVSSWATTDEDVERSAEAMIRIARTVLAGPRQD
jgi:threonine aldolase